MPSFDDDNDDDDDDDDDVLLLLLLLLLLEEAISAAAAEEDDDDEAPSPDLLAMQSFRCWKYLSMKIFVSVLVFDSMSDLNHVLFKNFTSRNISTCTFVSDTAVITTESYKTHITYIYIYYYEYILVYIKLIHSIRI